MAGFPAAPSGPMARRPRLDRFAAAATLLAALAGAPAGASAQSAPAAGAPGACPGGAPPKIAVVADVPAFNYVERHPVAELARLRSGDAVTTDHAGGKPLGLTRQSFALALDTTKARVEPGVDGSACVGLSDGAIVFRLNTDIYLASELPPQSCLYGQVRAHEERHAKVGKRLFTEFTVELEQAIAAALAKAPFEPLADERLAAKAAGARLRRIIEPIYENFLQTYRKRQAIIDSSGEFARVAETCPGEQERFLGR